MTTTTIRRTKAASPTTDGAPRGPIPDNIILDLRSEKGNWSIQSAALEQLSIKTRNVKSSGVPSEIRDLTFQLRHLAPHFATLIKDLRSTLVKQVCICIENLAESLGPAFSSAVDVHVIPALLKRMGATKAIIRNSAKDAASAIFHYGLAGISDFVAQTLSQTISDRKNPTATRASAALFVGMFFADKNTKPKSSIQHLLYRAIIDGVEDPHAGVRAESRINWEALAAVDELAASTLLSEMPAFVSSALSEKFEDRHARRISQPPAEETPSHFPDLMGNLPRLPRRNPDFNPGLNPFAHNTKPSPAVDVAPPKVPVVAQRPPSNITSSRSGPRKLLPIAPALPSTTLGSLSSYPNTRSIPFRLPRRSTAVGGNMRQSLARHVTEVSRLPSSSLKDGFLNDETHAVSPLSQVTQSTSSSPVESVHSPKCSIASNPPSKLSTVKDPKESTDRDAHETFEKIHKKEPEKLNHSVEDYPTARLEPPMKRCHAQKVETNPFDSLAAAIKQTATSSDTSFPSTQYPESTAQPSDVGFSYVKLLETSHNLEGSNPKAFTKNCGGQYICAGQEEIQISGQNSVKSLEGLDAKTVATMFSRGVVKETFGSETNRVLVESERDEAYGKTEPNSSQSSSSSAPSESVHFPDKALPSIIPPQSTYMETDNSALSHMIGINIIPGPASHRLSTRGARSRFSLSPLIPNTPESGGLSGGRLSVGEVGLSVALSEGGSPDIDIASQAKRGFSSPIFDSAPVLPTSSAERLETVEDDIDSSAQDQLSNQIPEDALQVEDGSVPEVNTSESHKGVANIEGTALPVTESNVLGNNFPIEAPVVSETEESISKQDSIVPSKDGKTDPTTEEDDILSKSSSKLSIRKTMTIRTGGQGTGPRTQRPPLSNTTRKHIPASTGTGTARRPPRRSVVPEARKPGNGSSATARASIAPSKSKLIERRPTAAAVGLVKKNGNVSTGPNRTLSKSSMSAPSRRTVRASSAIGNIFSNSTNKVVKPAGNSQESRPVINRTTSTSAVGRPPIARPGSSASSGIQRTKTATSIGASHKTTFLSTERKATPLPPKENMGVSKAVAKDGVGVGVKQGGHETDQSGTDKEKRSLSQAEELQLSIAKLRGMLARGRGDWRSRLEKMKEVKSGLEALNRDDLNASIAEECLSVIGEAMNDIHHKMTVVALDCLFLLLLRTKGEESSALQKLVEKRVDVLRRVLHVCKDSKEDVRLAGQRVLTSFEVQFTSEAQVGLLLKAMGIEAGKPIGRTGIRPGVASSSYGNSGLDARVMETGCAAVKKALERAESCDGGFVWTGSMLNTILVAMHSLSKDRRVEVRRGADRVVNAINRCLPDGAFQLACRKYKVQFPSIIAQQSRLDVGAGAS